MGGKTQVLPIQFQLGTSSYYILLIGQSLATKLVVALGYKLT